MADVADSILKTFDFVWERLLARLAGLSNEEYLWEPVPGCWSVRPAPDGRWRLDGAGGGGAVPDPVPVTTIAWRLGHLGGLCLGGFADRRFGDGTLRPRTMGYPAHADAVESFLGQHFDSWRSGLAGLTPAEWEAPLGEGWGPYAPASTVDLALHVLDEVIHHAAEVGVLRDLYPYRATLLS
jgi:hypothetical protein